MFLKVSAASTVTLEDALNFRAFKVMVARGDTELETVRSALANVATLPDRTLPGYPSRRYARGPAMRTMRNGRMPFRP